VKTGSGLGPELERAPAETSRTVARSSDPIIGEADVEQAVAPEPASALDEVTRPLRESYDDEAPISSVPISAVPLSSSPASAPLESLAPDTLETPLEAEVPLDEAALPLPEAPDEVTKRVIVSPVMPVTAPEAPPSSRRRPPVEAAPAVPAPVLIDVTPLTLSVETVGGYCDALIARNTPVPCDRSRTFATAVDDQTTVRVRVGQGESTRFGENTLLGELELSALRPAPRGTVEIAVTFALDTNGMLNVSARDLGTGRATEAQLTLVGLPQARELEGLAARHAAQRTG